MNRRNRIVLAFSASIGLAGIAAAQGPGSGYIGQGAHNLVVPSTARAQPRASARTESVERNNPIVINIGQGTLIFPARDVIAAEGVPSR